MKKLHLVFCTDSLSLPRPWKKNAPLEDPDLFTRFDETYPFLLQDAFVKHNACISLLAKRGGTSKDVLLQAEDVFFWRSPSLVILHVGIVDCWPRGEEGKPIFDIDVFRKHLIGFLEIKRKYAYNLPLIVVGLSPTNTRSLARSASFDLKKRISDYNTVLKDVFEDDAHFLDMDALFQRHNEVILHPDGHHLSRYGHWLVYKKLEEIMKDILDE